MVPANVSENELEGAFSAKDSYVARDYVKE